MSKPTGRYYLVKGLSNLNPHKNFNSEWRIALIPESCPYPIQFKTKAHESLKHLKKYDLKYQELKNSSNPKERKAAQKMVDPKFICDFQDLIFTPLNLEWNQYAVGLLEHSIHGKWTNGQVSGFHLLNRHSIGLVKWSETLPADSKGVWKGEFHFERNGKSASKISTMFPLNWSPTHLMFEAYSAFQEIDLNLEFVNQTTRTSSGIPVVMRLENQTVKTFYPLHQTDLEN